MLPCLPKRLGVRYSERPAGKRGLDWQRLTKVGGHRDKLCVAADHNPQHDD